VDETSRIGLIGPNGAGKTTLLSVLCGELEADDGVISLAGGKSVGLLRQDGGLSGGGSILSEMERVFADLDEMEAEMRRLEADIAETPPEGPLYRELESRYSALQLAFESKACYRHEWGWVSCQTSMPAIDTPLYLSLTEFPKHSLLS